MMESQPDDAIYNSLVRMQSQAQNQYQQPLTAFNESDALLDVSIGGLLGEK